MKKIKVMYNEELLSFYQETCVILGRLDDGNVFVEFDGDIYDEPAQLVYMLNQKQKQVNLEAHITALLQEANKRGWLEKTKERAIKES